MATPRVFDAFLFCDELDLLDVRLRTLDTVVDRFVLVEAPVTFQGKPKPLWYAEYRDRFVAWADRIVHVVVDDMLSPGGNIGGVGSGFYMARENYARAAIVRGLTDAAPDDLVLIGDADEIAKPWAVAAAEAASRDVRYVELLADTDVWRVGWRHPEPWHCTVAVRARDADPVAARAARAEPGTAALAHASWHFTWLGGVEAAWAKINAFSHAELLASWNVARLAERIGERRDIHGVPLAEVDVDWSYPEAVQQGALRAQPSLTT